MRILFITSSPSDKYGPGVWLRNLINGLDEKGHEAHILTWYYNDGLDVSFIRKRLYKVLAINKVYPVLDVIDPIFFGFLPTLFHVSLRASKIIKQFDIDVIHTDHAHYGFSAAVAKMITRKPLVTTIHGDYSIEIFNWFRGPRARLYIKTWNYLERVTLMETDCVTLPCAYLRNMLAYQLRGTPSLIIPNGVFIPKLIDEDPLIMKRFDFPSNKKMLLAVTNFIVPQKVEGTRLLIKAFAKVFKAHPETFLVIVGGGPYLTHQIKKEAENLPVYFLGYIDKKKLCDLFRACHVFVHSSFLDVLPLSVLEAMGFGKTVVATNIGGIPGVIKDGVNGLLASLTVDDFAENVLWILDNDQLRKELGTNAREKIEQCYTWTNVVRMFEELYNKLANKKG